MTLAYVFHPLAATELDEAVEHYENIQTGKGLDLLATTQKAIQHICSFPEAAPPSRGTVRSKLISPRRRWHYTIHYPVKDGAIRILAFAHQKQQPFYWFARR